jgi:quercetin dioxygenase-like cupin family protein
MKSTVWIVLCLCVVLSAGAVLAEDASKAAPGNYKIKMENDRVRVYDVTIKAGEKVPSHSHPDHMAYAVGDCKLQMTDAAGKTQDAEIKAGGVVWMDAVTHSAVNTGKTDCNVVVIELKEPKAAKH